MKTDETIERILEETTDAVNKWRDTNYTVDEVKEIINFIVELIGASFMFRTAIHIPFIGKLILHPQIPYKKDIQKEYRDIQNEMDVLTNVKMSEVDKERKQKRLLVLKKQKVYIDGILKEISIMSKIEKHNVKTQEAYTKEELKLLIEASPDNQYYPLIKELKECVKD